MLCRLFVTTTLVALLASGSHAAVQETANGFLVRHEVNVSAPAARVYEALVGQVGSWWSSEHTWSGDSKNLSIDARPGGCFCERFEAGGGVEHMRVVYALPGEILRLSGALGPLQGSGVAGSLTVKLTRTPPGTVVELSYGVGGFVEGGFQKIAPAVDVVLGDQLRRLKRFIETGKPTEQAD